MGRNILLSWLVCLTSTMVMAQSSSIIGSKHDLSVTGGGTVKSNSESRVCIFCHTPHNSNPNAPLWNRDLSEATNYTLYDNNVSSTLNATPGQPDGSSLLCLSCHDGTIALGNIVSSPTDIGGLGALTSGDDGYLSTDLSDDHPVSFVYSTATSDPEIQSAPIAPAVLDANGKVQCSSCHDAHDNMHGKFLVESNINSALCLRCHKEKMGWSGSSHSTSTATWNGSGTNPWTHISDPPASPHSQSPPYSTVAENACNNCHDTHSAQGNARLLRGAFDKDNCLDCHNGNVASPTANIASQVSKPYNHNISGNPGNHQPTESTLNSDAHVECQDCHNPHAAAAGQPFLGVKGIAQDGVTEVDNITYEYELCNRCHSSTSVIPSATPRNLGDNNVMNDFNPSNISHHAVLAPGNNPSPRGLIAPLSASSQIKCSDCHASDGSGAAKGPHGSIYPRILKANYNLNVSTNLPNHSDATLATEFALCAQCHDMTTVNSIHSTMKGGHFLAYTTCNSCHDPHGYSGGDPLYNSHLINMSTIATGPTRRDGYFLQQNGDGTGVCAFECHAKSHMHSAKSTYQP